MKIRKLLFNHLTMGLGVKLQIPVSKTLTLQLQKHALSFLARFHFVSEI